jgi:hypothetical protein
MLWAFAHKFVPQSLLTARLGIGIHDKTIPLTDTTKQMSVETTEVLSTNDSRSGGETRETSIYITAF